MITIGAVHCRTCPRRHGAHHETGPCAHYQPRSRGATCSSCAHWVYTETTPDPPDCEPVEWGDCRVSGDPCSEYQTACEAWLERVHG